MNRTMPNELGNAWQALRRVAPPAARARERCDLCGAGLAAAHEHLFEPRVRKVVCACGGCAVLFDGDGESRYRRLGREVRYLPAFRQSDAEWEAFGLPIGLAFFFQTSPARKVVALYPSPAGPTESLIDLSAWSGMERQNPVLGKMKPDAEGLLVNRILQSRDYYLVPLDVCFELTGLIRSEWRGLSGGAGVWRAVRDFFTALKARSAVAGVSAHG